MATRGSVSLIFSLSLVALMLLLPGRVGASSAKVQATPTARPASADELVAINLELCCPGNNPYGSPSPSASGLELVNAKRQAVRNATSNPTYVRVGFHIGNVAGNVSIPMTRTWTYQTWNGSHWTIWGEPVTKSVHVVNLWNQDHHFRFLLPASYLASGSSKYRVVVRLTIGPHTRRGAIVFHGPVRGQTSPTATPAPTILPSVTPSPTVTPTATRGLPSGRDLLAGMTAAIEAKGSYHSVSSSRIAAPHLVREIDRSSGDLSLKPYRLHSVTMRSQTELDKRPPATKTRREELTIVGNSVAARTNGGAWSCTNIKSFQQATNQVLSTLLGSAKIESVDTLGHETVDGVAV